CEVASGKSEKKGPSPKGEGLTKRRNLGFRKARPEAPESCEVAAGELLVHDEEGAEAMEVVGVAFAVEVVVEVGDVGAFADVVDVGEAVGVAVELGEDAGVPATHDRGVGVRDVAAIDGAVERVDEHEGA